MYLVNNPSVSDKTASSSVEVFDLRKSKSVLQLHYEKNLQTVNGYSDGFVIPSVAFDSNTSQSVFEVVPFNSNQYAITCYPVIFNGLLNGEVDSQTVTRGTSFHVSSEVSSENTLAFFTSSTGTRLNFYDLNQKCWLHTMIDKGCEKESSGLYGAFSSSGKEFIYCTHVGDEKKPGEMKVKIHALPDLDSVYLSNFSKLSSWPHSSWEGNHSKIVNSVFTKEGKLEIFSTKSSASFTSLPPEILQEIFSFMDYNELEALMYVDSMLCDHIRGIRQITISSKMKTTLCLPSLESVKFLPGCYDNTAFLNIKSLEIVSNVSEKIQLGKYTKLESLTIRNSSNVSMDLCTSSLCELIIEKCILNGIAAQQNEKFFGLRRLSFAGTKVSDIIWPNIYKSLARESLDLEHYNISNCIVQNHTLVGLSALKVLVSCGISFEPLKTKQMFGTSNQERQELGLENKFLLDVMALDSLEVWDHSYNDLKNLEFSHPTIIEINLTGCSELKILELDCPKLKRIHLFECHKELEIDKLRQRLPLVQIFF